MSHGRYVKPFDWPRHSGEPFVSLAGAYRALNELADHSMAKAEEISADQNLSRLGKNAQLRNWAMAEGIAPIKKGRTSILEARRRADEIRNSMNGLIVDKSDIAAAIVRDRVRTWLRDMDPAERNSLLMVDRVDPHIAAAIIEAPNVLSGVTAQQKQLLEARLIHDLNPEKSAQLRAIQQATEAVESAERAARLTLQRATGVGEHELGEALGEPNKLAVITNSLSDHGGVAA